MGKPLALSRIFPQGNLDVIRCLRGAAGTAMTAQEPGVAVQTAGLCRQRKPMSVNAAADPVLVRFRTALDEMFGDQIERVVLFGSRARGDAQPDSDYDIAIFLKDFHDRWSVVDRLVPLVTDILYDQGAFIHALPYREGAYRERTPLMHEVRREGVDL